MAMYLWKCVVSEACSSLPSWLQRRLVATAPAQDQSLRLARGNDPNRTPSIFQQLSMLHIVISVLLLQKPEDIHSFERGP